MVWKVDLYCKELEREGVKDDKVVVVVVVERGGFGKKGMVWGVEVCREGVMVFLLLGLFD